jgi:hypothetical protein
MPMNMPFIGNSLMACIFMTATCYPTPPRYLPSSVPSDLSLTPDRWIFLRGTMTALKSKQGKPRAVTQEEEELADEGFKLANAILLSDCFKQGFTQSPMSHTKGRNGPQVYASMTSLPADLLRIEFYDGTKAHGTIGYDVPNESDIIHMNRYFVKTSYDVADNLLHEAAHRRGYIHESAREAESVPYTMNRIFEACATAVAHAGDGVIADSADE